MSRLKGLLAKAKTEMGEEKFKEFTGQYNRGIPAMSEELVEQLHRMINPVAGEDKLVSVQNGNYRIENSPHHGICMSASAVRALLDERERLTRERDEIQKHQAKICEENERLLNAFIKAERERDEICRALEECAASFQIGDEKGIDWEGLAREFVRRQGVAANALGLPRSRALSSDVTQEKG